MRKFFLVLLTALAACKGHNDELPQGILSKDKMVEVLIKIHIAEATVGIKNLQPDSASKLYKTFQNKILKDSGVGDSAYAKSYAYYVARPEEMDAIYGAVVDSLSLREARGKMD